MNTDNLKKINAKNDGQPVIIIDGTAFPIGYSTHKCTATAGDIRKGKTAAVASGIVEGTLEPSSGSGGTFAKITEFIAPHDAFSAVDSIDVSGFGEVDTWDGMQDFSDWNGTYKVTSNTFTESSVEKRVYKHLTDNKYFYRMYCQANGDYYWVFNTSPVAEYIYETDFYAYELTGNRWYNYEYEFSSSLNIVQNTVDYPKQDLVLNGNTASFSNGIIKVTSEVASFTSYTHTPEISCCYATQDSCLVGRPVALNAAGPAVTTTFTSNADALSKGYVIDQSSGDGAYPEACVVFNMNRTEGDYAWWTGNVGVSPSNPGWFTIEFPEAFVPSKIFIKNEVLSPEDFKNATFQGANETGGWDDLVSIVDSPSSIGYEQEHLISTSKKYKKFRMLFTESHSSGVSIQCFMIYKAEYIYEE